MRTLPTASTLAIALALAAIGASDVRAADMPEYPPIIEAPEPLPLPAAGGWYLRGDIGYKWYNDPSVQLSNPDYAGGTFADGRHRFEDETMGESFNVGIGAGYKFNDYLRADLTLDYETPGEIKGKLFCPGSGPDCHDHKGVPDSVSHESVDVTAWSALANVYADLGTYGGFTPYVGAGVGASYLVTSNYKMDPAGTTPDDEGSWNFAWALMAGTSYSITDQLSLDVGYRYLNLGDARTGAISDGNVANPQTTRVKIDDIDAHEVRVGLRYNLF
jgi:opacity protein-like surface antigen